MYYFARKSIRKFVPRNNFRSDLLRIFFVQKYLLQIQLRTWCVDQEFALQNVRYSLLPSFLCLFHVVSTDLEATCKKYI